MSRLAYVLATFPTLTETFIVGEILELRRRGVRIDLFALRRPATAAGQPDADALAGETTYGRSLLSPRLLRANLRAALSSPLRYVRTLALVIRGTWRNPVLLAKTLALFPQAVDFAEEMRARGITHIHAHWATYPASVALVISELTGRPFSFTAHAWDVSMIRTFLREKVERARFVVTCTGENQRDLAQLSRQSARVFLNHHGVTLDHFTPPAERPAGTTPTILACGALFERKGFADLVAACAILDAGGVPFRCAIVGDGPQRGKLEALISASHLGDRVQLVGPLPHGEVIRRYADADIFVLPCLARSVGVIDDEADILKGLEAWFEGKASVIKDGIPNVLVEAMAMAVPVVSTRTAGIPELIQHGENGLLVSAREPEQLAEAIRRLVEDPDLRRRLGQRGLDTVRSRFDRGRTVRDLADIFTAQLEPGPRVEPRLSGAVARATR